MRYLYIGTADGPDNIVFMRRVAFEKGGPSVDVDDPEVLAKLENNPMFKRGPGRPKKTEPVKVTDAETEEKDNGDEE